MTPPIITLKKKKILNRKAQYGTTIHESVEMFENNLKTMNLIKVIILMML